VTAKTTRNSDANSSENSEPKKISVNGLNIAWLKDFVVCFDKLLPTDLCKKIIDTFESDSNKKTGVAYSPGDKLAVTADKISTDLEILGDGPWRTIHAELVEHLSKAITGYASLAPGLQVGPLIASGFNVKRYDKKKGEFKWHFDSLYESSMSRQIAFVIYLNDVKTGGETEFFHQQVKAIPKAGSGVLFPTFWTHMHRGCIPLSGPKYILTSFAKFDLEAIKLKNS